jgi:Fur family ferric uptake transcriptional regulator
MIASTQTNHPLAAINDVRLASAPLAAACARLKAAGMRITQPRIAILTFLINRGEPTSIEQIHGHLAVGSCDLVTVYRCLAAFEGIGIVRRSFYHNGTSLYEINLGDTNRYHVVCKTTDRVVPIDPELTAELRQTIGKIEENLHAQGYTGVTHVAEFFGIAPAPNRGANVTVPTP